MSAVPQEILAVDAHDSRLIRLRHVREHHIHHSHKHAIFQRFSRVRDDGNHIGSFLRHIHEVSSRSVREFHSIDDPILKISR